MGGISCIKFHLYKILFLDFTYLNLTKQAKRDFQHESTAINSTVLVIPIDTEVSTYLISNKIIAETSLVITSLEINLESFVKPISINVTVTKLSTSLTSKKNSYQFYIGIQTKHLLQRISILRQFLSQSDPKIIFSHLSQRNP